MIMIIISIPICGNFLIGTLEDQYQKNKIKINKTEKNILIVLAGMVSLKSGNDNTLEFNGAVDRIHTGLDLFLSNKIDYLLLSGGVGFLQASPNPGENAVYKLESELIYNWIKSSPMLAGISRQKKKNILVEANSRNTHENARNTYRLLKRVFPENSLEKLNIYLVTSAYHMPRSVACFKKYNLKVIPVPVDYYTGGHLIVELFFPSVQGISLSTIALREYLGLLGYFLMGYI